MQQSIGSRIRFLRNKHNFSQKEVSEYLGISQSHLEKVESDKECLKLTKLLKLCDLFNVSEIYLLYGDDEGQYDSELFQKMSDSVDLETIARMNKILINLKFMNDLYHEHYKQN